MTGKKIEITIMNVFLKSSTNLKTKTMKTYHNLYLKCDVLLLANILEKFRNSSFKNYGLYPNHYLNVPVLRRDTMLNMTRVELEPIPDTHMYLSFEKVWELELSI